MPVTPSPPENAGSSCVTLSDGATALFGTPTATGASMSLNLFRYEQ